MSLPPLTPHCCLFLLTTNKQIYLEISKPAISGACQALGPPSLPSSKEQRQSSHLSPFTSPRRPPSTPTHTSGHARELECSLPLGGITPGPKSLGGSPLASQGMMAARGACIGLGKRIRKEAPEKPQLTPEQKKWLLHGKTCSMKSANAQRVGRTSSKAGLAGRAPHCHVKFQFQRSRQRTEIQLTFVC